MNYWKNISSIINFIDQITSIVYLSLFHEKNSLIIFIFHGLFCNRKEFCLNVVEPQNIITVEQFRLFIEYYLAHNYTFISPYDILEGLNKNKKYALINFDDGYYNCQNALPILKEYNVPAVFFISTNHVIYNKCFWWDVLFRQRIKQGISLRKIFHEEKLLKSKTNDEIEKYIALHPDDDSFCFRPSEMPKPSIDGGMRGDIDGLNDRAIQMSFVLQILDVYDQNLDLFWETSGGVWHFLIPVVYDGLFIQLNELWNGERGILKIRNEMQELGCGDLVKGLARICRQATKITKKLQLFFKIVQN